MLYKLVIICTLLAKGQGNSCPTTMADVDTQAHCQKQALSQSLKDNNAAERIYCIPRAILSEYKIK